MRAVREHVVPALVNIPAVRRRILTAISQLSIGYRGSSLSVDADDQEARGLLGRGARGLQAGDRVPDATLIDAEHSAPVALFDLITHGWILLLFSRGQATPESIDSLEMVARQVQDAVGDAVRSYLILDTPVNGGGAVKALLDPNREISQVFAAGKGLVALVRPDGYLGYRGRLDQPGELASYLARVFAMRLPDAEISPVSAAAQETVR
jgi:hypothetical protein